MRICSVRIENFRNFRLLEVNTGTNVVLVGENRAGKSNLIYALRLIFDPSLSDLERQLTAEDFWDGEEPFRGREIKVVVRLTDFADDPNQDFLPLSLLNGNCIIQTQPTTIAQITYLYKNVKKLDKPEKADIDDYEAVIYGGEDPNNTSINIREIRRNIPIQMIDALRDIATDNRVWQRSPLKRLVELSDLRLEQLEPYAEEVKSVSKKVLSLPSLDTLQTDIKNRLKSMVGDLYAIDPELGLNATTAKAIEEDLRLFADGDRQRALTRTSLGLQNTLYLALLSLWMEKQQVKRALEKERFIPIIALEEPEAHLHPHLQRLVFEDFLSHARGRKQPVIISTHSPHLVSAANIEDLILLRDNEHEGCTAKSAYDFLQTLDPRSQKDLARFLDITKSEMLFSKGVIFVEGDVEVLLIDEFARILGVPLDRYGISICNVYGTHFAHVVTLAHEFNIPFAVLTDGDKFNEVNGIERSLELLNYINRELYQDLVLRYSEGAIDEVVYLLREEGIFINAWTLEVSLLEAGFAEELKYVFIELGQELEVNVRAGEQHINEYLQERSNDNIRKVLKSIDDARWGKGRFAHRLVKHIQNKLSKLNTQEEKVAIVPEYILAGINQIVGKVIATS